MLQKDIEKSGVQSKYQIHYKEGGASPYTPHRYIYIKKYNRCRQSSPRLPQPRYGSFPSFFPFYFIRFHSCHSCSDLFIQSLRFRLYPRHYPCYCQCCYCCHSSASHPAPHLTTITILLLCVAI